MLRGSAVASRELEEVMGGLLGMGAGMPGGSSSNRQAHQGGARQRRQAGRAPRRLLAAAVVGSFSWKTASRCSAVQQSPLVKMT